MEDGLGRRRLPLAVALAVAIPLLGAYCFRNANVAPQAVAAEATEGVGK